MKNIFFLSLLACLSVLSCSKEEQQKGNRICSEFEMSVIAKAPHIENTKADLHNVVIYNFSKGNTISVVNLTEGTYLGNLSANEATSDASMVQKMVTTRFSGTLEGSIAKGDKLAFIYPATTGTPGTPFSGYDIDLSNQAYNGSTTPFSAYCQIMSTFNSSEQISDLFISFTNATSYLVLNVFDLPKDELIDNVSVNNVNNGINWHIDGNKNLVSSPIGSNTGLVTLNCAGKDVRTSTTTGAKSLYLAIPSCDKVDLRTAVVELVGEGKYNAYFSNARLDAGKFYSQNIVVTEYTLGGKPIEDYGEVPADN